MSWLRHARFDSDMLCAALVVSALVSTVSAGPKIEPPAAPVKVTVGVTGWLVASPPKATSAIPETTTIKRGPMVDITSLSTDERVSVVGFPAEVSLVWKGRNLPGLTVSYKVRLENKFGKVIAETVTEQETCLLKVPRPGEYRWRVESTVKATEQPGRPKMTVVTSFPPRPMVVVKAQPTMVGGPIAEGTPAAITPVAGEAAKTAIP